MTTTYGTSTDEDREKLVCPECGVDMATTPPAKHVYTHWPEYMDPARTELRSRALKDACIKGGVSPRQYERIKQGYPFPEEKY